MVGGVKCLPRCLLDKCATLHATDPGIALRHDCMRRMCIQNALARFSFCIHVAYANGCGTALTMRSRMPKHSRLLSAIM